MGFVSFVESSFFPIPPDVMLIPMSLARPERAYFYATLCTWTSVAGGMLGYAIGSLLYDSVGQWLIALYGYGDKVEAFREAYNQYGALDHPAQGADADPLQDRHHHVGLCRLQPAGCSSACRSIARGMRFYLLAFLLHRYGAARARRSSRSGWNSGCRSAPSSWSSASSPPSTYSDGTQAIVT